MSAWQVYSGDHEKDHWCCMHPARQCDTTTQVRRGAACRFHLQQLLNGKYDSELPAMESGSPEEERMEAEMERYLDGFKMQVSLQNRPKGCQ